MCSVFHSISEKKDKLRKEYDKVLIIHYLIISSFKGLKSFILH